MITHVSNKIACLAWGSLVWNRGKLPVDGWETDGPRVKVEFVRQSKDGRLTLVLYAAADPVPGLWASMKTKSLDEAMDKLAEREDCDRDQIGCWPSTNGSSDPPAIPGLRAWAASKGLDHVIWTALEPKFSGRRGNAPSAEQVVNYLRNLDLDIAKKAKKYVRCTPQQIDTRYRKHIVRCLGQEWEAASPAECEQVPESAASAGASTS